MIDFSWCKTKSTVAEAEKKRMIDFLGIDERDVVDKDHYWQLPILPERSDWQRFKMRQRPDDELYYFSSPQIGDHVMAGYAWCSDGQVRHYIIVR